MLTTKETNLIIERSRGYLSPWICADLKRKYLQEIEKTVLDALAFAAENELHGLLDAEQIATWIRSKQ